MKYEVRRMLLPWSSLLVETYRNRGNWNAFANELRCRRVPTIQQVRAVPPWNLEMRSGFPWLVSILPTTTCSSLVSNS